MTAHFAQLNTIWLFVLKTFVLSVYISNSNGKHLSRHNHGDQHYPVTYKMFHQLCTKCSVADEYLCYIINQKTIRSCKKAVVSTNLTIDNFVNPLRYLIRNLGFYMNKFLHKILKNSKLSNQRNLPRQNVRENERRITALRTRNPKIEMISMSFTRSTRSTKTLKLTSRSLPQYSTIKSNSSETTTPTMSHASSTFYNIIQIPYADVLTRTSASRPTLVQAINIEKINTTKHLVMCNESNSDSDGFTRRYESSFSSISLEIQKFTQALDVFERKFYMATYDKLSSISPLDRRENGISFVESGFFLFHILNALSVVVDEEAKLEIKSCLGLEASDTDKIEMIERDLSNLPTTSDELKFRWTTRLAVNGSWHPHETAAIAALRLKIEPLDATNTPEQLTKTLNSMVEEDSGGAMRNTFEEDELQDGARAVLMNTVYVRARWRAAPTLLNDTRPFRDAHGAPPRKARMIRINDIMKYADLTELDAEAVEISYTTPGLSLLLLVPRGRSLRTLSERVPTRSLSSITSRMHSLRVAATLPIYTLRMTLLLPNKLQAMGISRLVDTRNRTNVDELTLSHAVQRIMFWAEAGRNAFKDDGIEWDAKPDLEMMVDRPYLFYVRWHNFTLMNGNFVL